MEKKSSVVKSTIGAVLVFIILFVGVPSAILGLYLVVLGFISHTGAAGDLSGLGVIFGFLMLVFGIVLLLGIKPAFLLLKRGLYGRGEGLTAKERKLLVLSVVIIAAFPLFFSVRHLISWKTKKGFELTEEKKKIEEMRQLMDKKIEEEFQRRDIVTVMVRHHWVLQDNPEFRQADVEKKKAMGRKFILKNFVEPIGVRDMPNFRFEAWTAFIAEVTKVGYAKLKRSKYVELIKFVE